GARVARRVRWDLGRPPGPRPAGDRDLRWRARQPAAPEGPAATGGLGLREGTARPARAGWSRDGGRRPAERVGRAPVPRCLVEREWGGGDQQPDGGRGHGRDLALPALAMAGWRDAAGRRPEGDRRA